LGVIVSAGTIVIAEHAALILTLFVAPRVPLAVITLACLVALGLSALLLMALPTLHYKRADAEALLLAGKGCQGKAAIN